MKMINLRCEIQNARLRKIKNINKIYIAFVMTLEVIT